jgi:hypothetical protein
MIIPNIYIYGKIKNVPNHQPETLRKTIFKYVAKLGWFYPLPVASGCSEPSPNLVLKQRMAHHIPS